MYAFAREVVACDIICSKGSDSYAPIIRKGVAGFGSSDTDDIRVYESSRRRDLRAPKIRG